MNFVFFFLLSLVDVAMTMCLWWQLCFVVFQYSYLFSGCRDVFIFDTVIFFGGNNSLHIKRHKHKSHLLLSRCVLMCMYGTEQP